MRVLLIDDRADQGWKEVLQKAVVKSSGSIEVVKNYDDACAILDNEFDLIFLDVRLTPDDHYVSDVKDMTGYKILQLIKSEFTNSNFFTPIILMTASNKVWHIEAFRQFGIDGFYIKEHPDYGFSKQASRRNLELLQERYEILLKESSKRKKVHQKSVSLINAIKDHKYFNNNSENLNVKNRIIDKLYLGYAYLFDENTEIRRAILKADNEVIAFIIYFSILEELVKGYSMKSNWNKDNSFKFNRVWKFRNKSTFIDYDGVKGLIEVDANQKKVLSNQDSEFSHYYKGEINLSEQVYSMLYHFNAMENEKSFKLINRFRNKIDYIHSSIANIYTNQLIDKNESKHAFDKINECLDLLNNLIRLPK